MKLVYSVIISLSLIFFATESCRAVVDPQDSPNNRFGIHIISEADIPNAAQLINSNGGRWGYITMVIRQDERNTERWTNVFKLLNQNRLIPIIRIATTIDKQNWKKPEIEDADIWASFLDSLPWPTTNRYVILFNEPNHAKEWGGQINPEDYGQILKTYSEILKAKSENFFILPAGLDASAKNIVGVTMDESRYLQRLEKAIPEFWQYIDGWSSHSYPQPNFQGSVLATGRGSVRTFDWEMSELKRLGLNKNLPIFITETGWRKNGYSEQQLNYFYTTAFNEIWNRKDIVAVTPFLLNYQDQPFADFSWQQQGSSEFFPHYYTVKNLIKTEGNPEQKHAVSYLSSLPQELVADSIYTIDMQINNTGLSIIDKQDGFKLLIESASDLEFEEPFFEPIMPGEKGIIWIKFHTGVKPIETPVIYKLMKGNQVIGEKQESTIKIFSFPDLRILMDIGFKNNTSDRWFELDLLDNGQLIHRFSGSTNDQASLKQVHNIVFGKKYLAKLKVYNSLPKELSWQPHPNLNILDFGKIWPIDLDNNDRLGPGDLWQLIKQPLLIKQLL